MKTTVEINKLKIFARHGVLPQETAVGNMFEVSVVLTYDFEQAALADDIDRTLNYAEAAQIIVDEMAVPACLLETVVMRLRTALTTRWPAITSGRIHLAKLHPPVPHTVASMAVAVEW